ncbi:UNVERIFIED_CONTAM: hypothetical protein H355_013392, partial [Colinus virginianus]
MDTVKRSAVDAIEAFVRSTDKVTVAAAITAVPDSPPNPLQLQESCDPRVPLTLWRLQDEEQKMRFLQSICTICDTAVQENKEQELHIFCHRNELVENIMVRGGVCLRRGDRAAPVLLVLGTLGTWCHPRCSIQELLSEEPRGKLCSELWQQAMAAITALSAVEAVLEDKIPLLTVCFQSILLLPSEQNLDISLYSRTLRALDQMLHTLVFVHPTASIGEELQSVFQVLLPFTCSQSTAAQQRAVGRIRKLSQSLALFCQAGPQRSMGRISLARYKELHLPVLGQLVGSLVLCCTSQEDRTRRSALSTLRHLYAFILGRARKPMAAGAVRWEAPQEDEQEKLKELEDDDEISLFTSTTDIVLRFAKHFHSSENTDLILMALQGTRDCSNYNTQVAANMMAALIDNFKPTANDVQRIVTAIHRWRKLITEKRPKMIIRGLLQWLATSDPHAVTLSLLHCSPTCDKDTWELWKMVLSSVDVVSKMVQEILQLLEMAPLSQETKIGSLPLAATIALHEIVQREQYDPQVRLYFPELFVALIFQMVSSGTRTPIEVTAVMADTFCPSAPTSAIRIVVEVLHNLLQCAGLEHLVHYMERHGLWGQLLGAATWRDGLRTLARESPSLEKSSQIHPRPPRPCGLVAQKALTRVAELLGWQQLRRLASVADMCLIADCLVQKAGRSAGRYVQQCVRHLQNPQASVREAAVRFL